MSVIDIWLRTSWAWSLGWALVHSVWQGALLAAVLGVVLLATRSARVRYAMACTSMLGMVAAFLVTLWLVGVEGAGAGRGGLRAFPAHAMGLAGGGSGGPSPNFAAMVPYLPLVWMAGASLFYLWCLGGWLSLRRLRRTGVSRAVGHWQTVLDRLREQLGVTRAVVLVESMMADAPVVLGHWRPMILMPLGMLAGLPVQQVEAILLHELAHIRRCDYLVNLLQRVVEGLFFYHPAVWWISHVVKRERENCCDDAAVAASGDRYEYARALAELEQIRHRRPEPAMAATGGSLMNRIRRLLAPKPVTGFHAPLFAGLLLVAVAMVLAAYQSDTSKPVSPYTKWLNEDVVYIIAAEERVAFERLKSDAERDKFIEQFWQRRGPTPVMTVNEVKEEHYRRLHYANQRFPTQSRPGWATDRGRIYIQWGPPDEIESHPSGRAGSPPFETWRYHQIERIGKNLFITFIDFARKGDYQVAPAPPVNLPRRE